MSAKNGKQRQNEGAREAYLVPRPAFLNPVIEFTGSHMIQFSIGAMLLFPILTALTAALWAAGASSSMFVGMLYGFILFLVASLLMIGYLRIDKRKGPPKFMQQAFRFNREMLASHNMRKNQESFLKTVLVVVLFMSYHFLMMKLIGRAEYPSEAFTIFLPRADDGIQITRVEPVALSAMTLLIAWGLIIWFVPKFLVFVLLFALHAMTMFLGLFGAIFFIQQAPFLLMMPLFMVSNFFMMFGPLAVINIMQIKVMLPGEGKADEGKEVRGQPYARKQLERVLYLFASKKGEELWRKGAKPPRGVVLEGPPGTGKTLFAKWAASILNAPIIITSGSAFIATFMGIDILVALFLKWKAHGLAKEYGRVMVFIDEAEQVFRRRGMTTSGMPGMMRTDEFWSLFKYDEHGSISSCGLTPITPYSVGLRQGQVNTIPTTNPYMFPGMMGGGGMALFVFLPWIDGFEAPPFWSRFFRNRMNYLLDVLWLLPPFMFVPLSLKYPFALPTRWQGRTISFRFGPAKPESHKVLFMIATNMPQMLDEAVTRSGRIEERVKFVMPDEVGRADILKFYLKEYKNEYGEPGIAHEPSLETDEKIMEIAKSTRGFSPADLESMLRRAVAIRSSKINRIEQLKDKKEEGQPFDETEEHEWARSEPLIQNAGWDTVWATWEDIVEALAEKQHGVATDAPLTAKKEVVVKKIQSNTGLHEVGGHLLTLFYFCGDFQTPTFISVVRRGEKLGLVAHAPKDEEEWADLDQRKIEGLMRVSLGSVAAERIFLESHDNGPGVSRDVENGSNIGLQMMYKWSMVPRKTRSDTEREGIEKTLKEVSGTEKKAVQTKIKELKAKAEEEYRRYEEYGEMVLSLPEGADGPARQSGGMAGLGLFRRKQRNLLIALGQAYVDDWRLIYLNKDVIPPMVEKVVAKGEVTGGDLDDMWNELKAKVKPLRAEHENLWPDVGSPNKFYDPEFSKGRMNNA